MENIFNILTFNVSLWYNIFNKSIIYKIRLLIKDYDIICLQECLIDPSLLAEDNFNYYNSEKLGYMNSGLVILYKKEFDMINSLTIKLDNSIGILRYIRPFVFISVDLKIENKIIRIYNIHLNPYECSFSSYNFCEKIVNNQKMEIREYVIENYKKTRNDFILLGDTNSNDSIFCDNLPIIINSFIPKIPTTKLNSIFNIIYNYIFNKLPNKVDHIYSTLKLSNAEILLNNNLSDHYPIIGIVDLNI
jgi:endonuclease/exonuclease/phosphatase family metal-dependent hydrolase